MSSKKSKFKIGDLTKLKADSWGRGSLWQSSMLRIVDAEYASIKDPTNTWDPDDNVVIVERLEDGVLTHTDYWHLIPSELYKTEIYQDLLECKL